ncbi:hypothetical protein [Flavobacterium silvaticum]|uniref:Uncharacterized protein n=1 Tax=Flavobacterium silvaticum TaxID=1852020 RepID=A0A972FIU1_9FLAO|nr:hypothetical protein [Flavobacterium silvaticum]NMH26462.1 hypothetical protein [Flavobacterium silvaticum]
MEDELEKESIKDIKSKKNHAAKVLATTNYSKSAFRYLNDTLFVSNFGSILVSLTKLSIDEHKDVVCPEIETILFAIFFIFFRVKSYLDDNHSLKEKERILLEKEEFPNTEYKIYFIIAILTWLSITVSGYFIFINKIYAFYFFGLSLIIFTIWILVVNTIRPVKIEKIESLDNETKLRLEYFYPFRLHYNLIEPQKNRLTYLILNICYLLVLFDILYGYTALDLLCHIGILLILLVGDFVYSKSLNNSFG